MVYAEINISDSYLCYKFPMALHILYEAHVGSCYFQVTLHSQVKATLTVYDAWLDLQDGFVHAGQGDGRPISGFFPLVVSSTSRAGLLFCVCLGKKFAEGMDFIVWII